jgi:hypothetical protein
MWRPVVSLNSGGPALDGVLAGGVVIDVVVIAVAEVPELFAGWDPALRPVAMSAKATDLRPMRCGGHLTIVLHRVRVWLPNATAPGTRTPARQP